ncbi:MAG: hypothetical protein COT15_05120 [Candidatus Diapherotrites archaeon CG08_land_8_20_14_0_20_34_12]|nr:MAG: hypothetical protein COT15_05120 [Candidatus Diapherotrites archaeon CG08_land_8_20_14_0_20_34_12]
MKLDLIIGAIIVLVLISIAGLVVMNMLTPKASNEKIADFAKCLTSKGAKMYGTFWCSHCKSQKELFGDAFQYITYVECDLGGGKTAQECIENNIDGYPRWIINGKQYAGEQTFQELAQASGCELKTE